MILTMTSIWGDNIDASQHVSWHSEEQHGNLVRHKHDGLRDRGRLMMMMMMKTLLSSSDTVFIAVIYVPSRRIHGNVIPFYSNISLSFCLIATYMLINISGRRYHPGAQLLNWTFIITLLIIIMVGGEGGGRMWLLELQFNVLPAGQLTHCSYNYLID